jgi:hypothetical protein
MKGNLTILLEQYQRQSWNRMEQSFESQIGQLDLEKAIDIFEKSLKKFTSKRFRIFIGWTKTKTQRQQTIDYSQRKRFFFLNTSSTLFNKTNFTRIQFTRSDGDGNNVKHVIVKKEGFDTWRRSEICWKYWKTANWMFIKVGETQLGFR